MILDKTKRIGVGLLTVIALMTCIMLMPACSSSNSVKKHNKEHMRTHRKRTSKSSNASTSGSKTESVAIEMGEVKVAKGRKEHKKMIEESKTWLGTPYRYAAQEKGVGTDCSGMVVTLYEDYLGVKLPRNSAKQAEYCKSLKGTELREGDLVFFATGKDPEKISHVGIILDSENFIHASTSKGVVISQLQSPYYKRTFRGFGRAE